MGMNDLISIVRALLEFDTDTLKVALSYASYMRQCGVDVTEKWKNAEEQAEALHKAYLAGKYEEQSKAMKSLADSDKCPHCLCAVLPTMLYCPACGKEMNRSNERK